MFGDWRQPGGRATESRQSRADHLGGRASEPCQACHERQAVACEAGRLKEPIATLEVEQKLLANQAPAEASEFTVRVDYAMARNEDDDRILAVCLAHGPNGQLIADASRLLEIGDSLAVSNVA